MKCQKADDVNKLSNGSLKQCMKLPSEFQQIS